MAGLYFAVLVLLTFTFFSSSVGHGTKLGMEGSNSAPHESSANRTRDSSHRGLGNNETRLMFLKRPPPFSVKDSGEIGEYDCVPNTEYWRETVNVKWRVPTHVDLDPGNLKEGYTVNGQSQSGGRQVYVSENNTLVFPHLEKHFRGGYSCELSVGGNITAVAHMRLHVIDVSDFNVVRSLITGLVACTVCALLIFGIYFLVARLRVKHDRKRRGEFELNADINDATALAEKSASPMLDE